MRELVLASVPHTGTWFTLGLFAGFTVVGLYDRPEGNTVYHGHIAKEGQILRALELAKRMPLVCPFRHPYRVEESWKRRGKSIREMVECFEAFFSRFYPQYVMPLDSPLRGIVLDEMSETLGLSLETDWSVVHGEKGTHALDIAELGPSPAVVALVERHSNFMRRFYGDEIGKADARGISRGPRGNAVAREAGSTQAR